MKKISAFKERYEMDVERYLNIKEEIKNNNDNRIKHNIDVIQFVIDNHPLYEKMLHVFYDDDNLFDSYFEVYYQLSIVVDDDVDSKALQSELEDIFQERLIPYGLHPIPFTINIISSDTNKLPNIPLSCKIK